MKVQNIFQYWWRKLNMQKICACELVAYYVQFTQSHLWMHQTWSERVRGNGEQSSRGVGRVGTMAAVNSRDKNRLEKRSSRRAWCTFGRHFLSSASARCAVAHVRLRWRRRRRLVAVGENFLFSSLAWQLRRRKGVFSWPVYTAQFLNSMDKSRKSSWTQQTESLRFVLLSISHMKKLTLTQIEATLSVVYRYRR